MDQFSYLADPRIAVRMTDSKHLEQVRKAEWRNARHVEELKRSELATRRAAGGEKDQLAQGPTSPRFSWMSWRSLIQSLRLAGSAR